MKKRFLGIVSILYSILIFYVWLTGKLNSFLAPNMQIYIKVAAVILLIMGLILLLNNKIKYKFKLTDLVLLLPIIMVVLAGDGNLSMTFARSKIMSKTNKTEDRTKDDIPQNTDDNTDDKNYDFDNVYFDIEDYNYSYLADYLTYMQGAHKFDGKTIRVRGFAIDYSEFLQDGYFALGKYAITCCAADAEFTGFAVKYDLSKIKYGSWYQIEGVLKLGKDKEGYTIMTLEAVNVKEIDSKNEEQYIYSCATYGSGKCDELLKYDLEY